MRVSDNITPADNLIKLVECLKSIEIADTKVSFYAEKLIDEKGREFKY